VYDVDLLRKLYQHIAVETNTVKADELCDLAHAVIWENEEEIRLRLQVFKEKYEQFFPRPRNFLDTEL
jgi:hypothetical protein